MRDIRLMPTLGHYHSRTLRWLLPRVFDASRFDDYYGFFDSI